MGMKVRHGWRDDLTMLAMSRVSCADSQGISPIVCYCSSAAFPGWKVPGAEPEYTPRVMDQECSLPHFEVEASPEPRA